MTPELLACASDYEAAQVAAKSGKLTSAARLATSCARDACPMYARTECLKLVEEYTAQIPSIIVVARDGEGCDTTNARVSVDGTLRLEKVDGRALEVDPGEHVVRVEAVGAPPEEQRIVAVQSEKDRPLKFGSGRAAECHKPGGSAPPPKQVRATRSGVTVAGMVVGGIGLAALTASAGLGIAGFVQRGELDACIPCSERQIADVRRTFIIGDVFLATGAALVATSIVLLVVGGQASEPEAKPKKAVSLTAAPLWGGAAALVQAPF